MTTSASARTTVLRTLFLGATALAVFNSPLASGDAAAKVGVTSATDGDPLGKPPAEAERVLRIGIDVQANELITTSANDRAHLVFLDGSSLTVGPNARLTIDKFVFDPNTKTGELAINASRGVLRLVGGKISKTTPIVITTPSSTVGIRGGITLLDVKPEQTASIFVFGRNMSVSAGGTTENVTRPGSQVITNFGATPGRPTLVAQGALAGQLSQLEGRSGSQGGGTGRGDGAADRAALTSGFSAANSGQVRIISLRTGDSFGTGPGPRNRNPNDAVVTAVTNATETSALQQAEHNQAVSRSASQQDNHSQSGSQSPPTQSPTLDPTIIPGTPGFSNFDLSQLQIHPNSRLTTVNELSTLNLQSATATYSGPALAFINGTNNVSGGTYQNAWNFGTRSGIATIKVDGSTYGGGATPNTFMVNNSPFFKSNSALPSTSGPQGRSLTLDGAFLSRPNNPAKQQIGVFNVTGPNNYKGVGVFSGTR